YSESTIRARVSAPLYLGENQVLGLSASTRWSFPDFGGSAPELWEDYQRTSLSLFSRTKFNDRWSLLLAPFVTFAGETDADFEDSLTYSGIGGAYYQFSDDLSLGLGLGAFGQLEDDTVIVPLLLLDWTFAEDWRLTTAPTAGFPVQASVTLEYAPSETWTYALTARTGGNRFRLADDSPTSGGGVGEFDTSRIAAALTYEPREHFALTLHAGWTFAGQLEVLDDDGRSVFEEDRDGGPVLGFEAALRF
ncbi:MAG: DUF6268 family outer membrane beta-barrel protein, partial [Verrucomicrobiota bacterium JB023]|nr:DUF6268 family outer membrane beta-barrel protein [Verrucomicrobiota bacterium JB023]